MEWSEHDEHWDTNHHEQFKPSNPGMKQQFKPSNTGMKQLFSYPEPEQSKVVSYRAEVKSPNDSTMLKNDVKNLYDVINDYINDDGKFKHAGVRSHHLSTSQPHIAYSQTKSNKVK